MAFSAWAFMQCLLSKGSGQLVTCGGLSPALQENLSRFQVLTMETTAPTPAFSYPISSITAISVLSPHWPPVTKPLPESQDLP